MKHKYILRRGILYPKSYLFALIMFFFLSIPAIALAQQRVRIKEKQITIERLLSQIGKQTGMDFVINTKLIQSAPRIDVDIDNLDIKAALQTSLQGLPLEYIITDKTVVIREKVSVNRPKSDNKQQRIEGVVLDTKGKPIIGASISDPKGISKCQCDQNGKFEMVMPHSSNRLVISMMGYEKLEYDIKNDEVIQRIVLREASNSIAEVEITVKTGYFEKNKQTFTGAATSFSGDELRTVTNQNILSALSVLDPSFKLMENNLLGSDPNSLPEFQIRGSSSISTSLEEKFKGNPNLPLFVLDGFEVSLEKIYDLDPLRINGITILKDASALAIYGSRGANGVVIVSTYAPRPGKLRATYTGNMDFDFADLSDYNLLHAADKLEYERLAGVYTPGSAVYVGERYAQYYNDRLKMVKQGIDTDWLTKPLKSVGVNHKHNVNLEGGDNTFRYNIGGYMNPSSGIMKGSSRDRTGLNITLNYNYKALKFSNQLTYDHVKSKNSPYGAFSTYAYLNPYYTPYGDNGDLLKILYRLESVTSPTVVIPNPMYNATINTKDETKYDNFINNFRAEWDLSTAFRFTGSFSINKKTQLSDIFKPSQHTDFISSAVKGRYQKSTAESVQYEGTLGFAYNKLFAEKHMLVLNANYNIRQATTDSYLVVAAGFPNDLMDHVGMGLEYLEGTRPQGSESTSRLIGALANFNYSYDNRFLADFAIRYDGSSQFGSNKKWGQFWSAGLGWNLHNESFLKDNELINLLKIRGSTGITGSQNFYPYQAQLTYAYNADLVYDNGLGAVATAYGNQDLKWQITQKRNIGVDFELLRSRLTGYFNYYDDNSKDVLIDVTMAPSLGFNTYKANLGEVANKGYELSLRGKIISAPSKQFYWNLFGIAVRNKNSLRKLSNALQAYNEKVDGQEGNKPSVRYIEGQSVNTIWVVESLGIDPASGQEVFIDKTGKLTNVWDAQNYKAYGTTDPKLEGTFGTIVGMKGFECNVFFRYKFGGYLYNNTLVDRVENVNPNQNVDQRVFFDRWKTVGDVSGFKGITNRSVTRPTSRFIEKDNVLELKSVNISYNFKAHQFVKNIGAQSFRVTAYLNDVFRASSVKVERGIDYPFARHYALGVQATF
ncbi:SusC/RagA family TonB-linked outer membrane protein [Sphingobacterium faecale]|uniref:SusC/RagA family TonB-linked outer membrane protein n=1 Tax=Sphingobacterium faecale TaxID=2803775 RepID=A0ABS1R2U8_9SPHI|nr:SusC/RagA family TonB-linked outer membrane protein [Sphingobacterium faecale]MBL1409026.1 SusC/RagA family TonB-linked outer membrane protein [Sphingobacterium faecale]